MRIPAASFQIALALGAMILVSRTGAQAQDAQEGPREIEKCRTIDKPGSYKLVNNLTAASGAVCLDITASFVTIDLAGFSISGATSGLQFGPAIAANTNTTGITVRNGSIFGFGAGVALEGNLSIVEGLRLVGFADAAGGRSGISATGIVKGNTVADFVGNPGARSGVGISATGIVTGNYVIDSGRADYEIGQGSTVIGNTAGGSGEPFSLFGISVSCPSNVTNNTAVNHSVGNIVLNGTGCNDTNNVAP
jgi:hypothetical protein